jgi:hypothetical protein
MNTFRKHHQNSIKFSCGTKDWHAKCARIAKARSSRSAKGLEWDLHTKTKSEGDTSKSHRLTSRVAG